VKNGNVRGFQRYRCLFCGYNFTMTPPRGKPAAMKALALLLYAMGNVSFGSIARLLGVSDVAVLNWVRDEARKLPEPSTKADVVVVTLDEMWHVARFRRRTKVVSKVVEMDNIQAFIEKATVFRSIFS